MSRVPDFFIVGHPMSGTAALCELLRRHPRIYVPEVAEPCWFARDIAGAATQGRTYEEYLALFEDATPDQLAGEATAVYIWSPTAAAAIAEAQPQARIIVILREPASYLRALHLGLLGEGIESEADLLTAIELEPLRTGPRTDRAGEWPWALRYSRHVRYVEQLHRFHACFPDERMLAIVYDDLRAETETTVRGVLRFLGADSGGEIAELGEDTGAERGTRLLQRMRGTIARQLLPSSPRPSSEEQLLELRHRFKPEVQALSDHLQRDLVAQWGYDGIA